MPLSLSRSCQMVLWSGLTFPKTNYFRLVFLGGRVLSHSFLPRFLIVFSAENSWVHTRVPEASYCEANVLLGM